MHVKKNPIMFYSSFTHCPPFLPNWGCMLIHHFVLVLIHTLRMYSIEMSSQWRRVGLTSAGISMLQETSSSEFGEIEFPAIWHRFFLLVLVEPSARYFIFCSTRNLGFIFLEEELQILATMDMVSPIKTKHNIWIWSFLWNNVTTKLTYIKCMQ